MINIKSKTKWYTDYKKKYEKGRKDDGDEGDDEEDRKEKKSREKKTKSIWRMKHHLRKKRNEW